MNNIESAENIRKLIIQLTPNNWSQTEDKFLNGADRSFWMPRRSDIQGILDECPVGHQGNQGEVFDCDDYAVTFKSRLAYLAVRNQDLTSGRPIAGGIFWGRASWSPDPLHAANWFVTREGDLFWIEPQFNNASARAEGRPPIRSAQDSVTHLRVMMF